MPKKKRGKKKVEPEPEPEEDVRPLHSRSAIAFRINGELTAAAT